jgi:indolepyruvate ferredoxin oxidoreductase
VNDNPLLASEGTAVLDGNELIVKGALEAGVALITGYPGSPVANVFDVVEAQQAMFRERGIKCIIANNENQSAAMLHGAMTVPGVYAMAVFKSVGAYVALDGMAITNATIAAAGSAAVCVAGDDPALSSTQVGADSRYTFLSAKIPVIEPGGNQEIKDWIRDAFELARDAQLLVGYIVTTNQADGGGTVVLRGNRAPAVNMHARVAIDVGAIRPRERVAVPPNSGWMERDMIERRIPKLMELLRAGPFNRIEEGPDRRTGFISSGNAYNYLRHALLEMDLDGRYPVLVYGCTWPLEPDILLRFAATVDRLVVVEEKRGFIEDQAKQILRDAQQSAAFPFRPVYGKQFPGGLSGIPEEGALTPGILIDRIGRLLIRTKDEE